jgi:hypothetical protein
MSSFTRKRGKLVYVFVNLPGKTRTTALPRSETQHLDGQPDHNILFFINEWERKQGLNRPPTTNHLQEYIKKFITHYKDVLNRHENTVKEHERFLINHIVPYYLALDPPLADPNYWPSKSIQMMAKLKEQDMSDGKIKRANLTLKLFYKWLTEENYVLGDGKILTRNPGRLKSQPQTPLKVMLTPEHIMKLAREQIDDDIALLLVFGYFFSLRTQESFGLMVDDIKAGSVVLNLECSKTMKSLGYWAGMVLKVDRQKEKNTKVSTPKNNSKGWVCCWNKDAAAFIIKRLEGKKPEEFIFKTVPNVLYKKWKDMEFGFALKDLRRMSLYHLGHFSQITSIQLMKHARQKSEEALSLYLRRPEEDLESYQKLELID